jgi:hypothetical protein
MWIKELIDCKFNVDSLELYVHDNSLQVVQQVCVG